MRSIVIGSLLCFFTALHGQAQNRDAVNVSSFFGYPLSTGNFTIVTEYTVNVANDVSAISITGEANQAGATVVGNVTDKALMVGDNTIIITITAVDGTTKTYTVTVIRAGAAPVITTATLAGGTVGVQYNATLSATGDAPIALSISAGNLPDGLTLNAGVISGTPTKANTFDFSVRASNNAGNDTKPLSITIAKGAGASITAPTLASKTANSITINAVSAPSNGQLVEYACNTTNAPLSSGWQTDLTFMGLSANTTYYIFARAAENANYLAGTASTPLQTTTDKLTSVETSDAPLARVYPNPTDGVFTLEFETDDIFIVTLADMTGKALIRQTVKGQRVQMDLSNYPAGVYLLTIDEGKRQNTTRVVKN